MSNFLKKPIELPRSGPLFVVIAILTIALTISDLAKDNRNFGHYLFGSGILLSIVGSVMAFSKKERERTRARVLADLPERAALINAPGADKIVQRRGYYTLVLGLALFLIWLWFFGFSTFAIRAYRV